MTKVIRIGRDRDWWKAERDPADSAQVIVKKRRPLSDRYFSVSQLASKFGVGTNLIYGLIHGGTLDAERIGRTYRVSLEALETYLERSKKRSG